MGDLSSVGVYFWNTANFHLRLQIGIAGNLFAFPSCMIWELFRWGEPSALMPVYKEMVELHNEMQILKNQKEALQTGVKRQPTFSTPTPTPK